MGSKLLACSECSNACLTFHKNKLDPNPIVVSFFKIMFGNQFSEVLIVPPKFAKTIMHLNGGSTYLEDSTGQKWEVNISNLNGSLAFQKGWHEFSVDHDIQLGDLLVFYYFKGSHFNVQIFGRSGCEKPMIFGGKDYQNNRAKVTKDYVPRSDPCDFPCNNDSLPNESLNSFKDTCHDDVDVIQKEVDVANVRKSSEIGTNVPNGNTNKRPKVVPTTDFLAESLIVANRNASSDDNRDNSLFDLSIFEMPKKEEVLEGMSTLKGNQCSALQITPSQLAEDEKDRSRKESELLPISQVDVPLNVSMPIDYIDFPRKRKRIVKQEPNSDANIAITDDLSWDSLLLSTTKNHRSVDKSLDRKFISTSVVEDKGRREMSVTQEALNFCDSRTLDAKITCLVNNNSEFFLLPKALPVQVCTEGENSEQKTVLLRDPVGRLWPVIYHQRKGLDVLGSGWKEFRKSNCIQRGDECTFVVENIDEGIVQVQISHSC